MADTSPSSRAPLLHAAGARIQAGLIGRNIGGSRSPWMHEQEGAAQGLALSYQLFDFAAMGRDESFLPTQLEQAERQGFSGLNVTYPYKQAVVAFLDELTAGASRVGAVNTVQLAGGRRIGHNTDVTGFAESMQAGLQDVSLRRVLQMGAGGAGAATAVALLDLGVERLLICDRDAVRAQELVAKLKRSFANSRVQAMPAPPGFADVDGIVNATPMGMSAQLEPPIDTALLAPHQWVADIVYFPLETQLLLAARARGCRTLDGSGMAVYQAADAFEIFTGRIANRPRMLRSFREFTGQASRAESARD